MSADVAWESAGGNREHLTNDIADSTTVCWRTLTQQARSAHQLILATSPPIHKELI